MIARSNKSPKQNKLTLENFIVQHGYPSNITNHEEDLTHLKRLAIFTIAFMKDERLLNKALSAIGVRTDKNQLRRGK